MDISDDISLLSQKRNDLDFIETLIIFGKVTILLEIIL